MSADFLQYEMPLLNGKMQSLQDYKGKVLLIVNTASKCGFTSQYKGLEALYKKYEDDGLVILGFPCNQFGEQEKGGSEEIAAFCEKNFGVTFPVFQKIDVNGKDAAPLYKDLRKDARGFLGTQKIKWNFTKFLVNRDGKVLDRFGPTTKPESLDRRIKRELKK